MQNNMTIKKLMNRQDKIVELLNKKLTTKEQSMLAEAINIEYELTMVEEGHELETLDIYRANKK